MNLAWRETENGKELIAKVDERIVGEAKVAQCYALIKMIAEVNGQVVDGCALTSISDEEVRFRLTQDLNRRGYN